MDTLLRYPYEVRSENEYFDDIQDVKVTKDMLDLAKHNVNQKPPHSSPNNLRIITKLRSMLRKHVRARIIAASNRRTGHGKPIVP
jgi:DNA end-binding protein Ku